MYPATCKSNWKWKEWYSDETQHRRLVTFQHWSLWWLYHPVSNNKVGQITAHCTWNTKDRPRMTETSSKWSSWDSAHLLWSSSGTEVEQSLTHKGSKVLSVPEPLKQALTEVTRPEEACETGPPTGPSPILTTCQRRVLTLPWNRSVCKQQVLCLLHIYRCWSSMKRVSMQTAGAVPVTGVGPQWTNYRLYQLPVWATPQHSSVCKQCCWAGHHRFEPHHWMGLDATALLYSPHTDVGDRTCSLADTKQYYYYCYYLVLLSISNFIK